ncbi:unnamed protein product [Triticum turgidum subsp. durum]|uniref:Histone chaperone domain-containing protein n=1 Tax=Triticum turgidum subsp. durum TaxID=4567 RepID=A0A9R0WB39_TRITD|nr:unnamed protein product [Triticum turgidum subsp. durum]
MEADGAAAAAATRGREAEIMEALRARVPFFKKQADYLTLEGVRRTLEKDMDLKINSLDPHKKFIRQCVDKVFSGCDNENTDNASERAEAKVDNLSEDAQPMSGSNKISSSPDEQGARSSETDKDPEGLKNHSSGSNITEAMIKKAIDKRASYFRENSETLTLLGVRRTLEEDLKLERKALDAFKDFITKELDRVLQEPENGTTDHSKQEACKDAGQKTSKGSKRARQDSDTSELNNSHSEKEDSDEDIRPIKRGAEKGRSLKQQIAKRDYKSDKDQGQNSAEDNPLSSAVNDKKAAPAHGKRVERLKSVIKSCGMSVPPSVYRRAKQAPESKREACLIKELEDILEKEGLSSHPSEKEIKAVRKRKERAKDLEGIDMSNIITSSRRRNASSFIPLPVPKIEADSDSDDDDGEEENVEGGDKGDDVDAEAGDGSADDAGNGSD